MTSVFSKEKITIPKSMCENVDMRDNNPQFADFFSSPRSQDSIGWCYGFSAADLLSAELGKPVSAAHASILYNKKVQGNFFWRLAYKFQSSEFDEVYEGGFAKKALKLMQKNKKVCLEEDLPFDENYSGELERLIKELESLKGYLKSKIRTVKTKCRKVSEFLSENYGLNISVNELYSALVSENLNIVLDEIAKKQCAGKEVEVPKLKVRKRSMPRMSRFSNESHDEAQRRFVKRMTSFFNIIDNKLKDGKPVEVSYNVKHVTNFKGLHSSVVTGRRWHNGRCEFKVRNSWGRSCYSYDNSEISQCDREEGAFWVADQKFYEMVNNITYID